MLAIGFYEQVLVELMAAVGAALFVGNMAALVRRSMRSSVSVPAGAPPGADGTGPSGPDEPVPGSGDDGQSGDLAEAPVLRSLVYAGIGFVVMVWGLVTVFG